jgi:hypothetical protein
MLRYQMILGLLKRVAIEKRLLGRWTIYSDTHRIFQQVDWANNDHCSCEVIYRIPPSPSPGSSRIVSTLLESQRFQQDREIEVFGCICE